LQPAKRENGLVCDRLSTAAQADDAQHKKTHVFDAKHAKQRENQSTLN
jgi:hypothetical protein